MIKPVRTCIHCGNKFVLEKSKLQSKRHPGRINYSTKILCSEKCKKEHGRIIINYRYHHDINFRNRKLYYVKSQSKQSRINEVVKLSEEHCTEFVKRLKEIIPRTKLEDINNIILKECKEFTDNIVNEILRESLKGSLVDLRSMRKPNEVKVPEENMNETKEIPAVIPLHPLNEKDLEFNERFNSFLKENKLPASVRTLMKFLGIHGDDGHRRMAVIKKLIKLGYDARKEDKRTSPYIIYPKIESEISAIKHTTIKEVKENLNESLAFEFSLSNMIPHKKLKDKYGVEPKDVEVIAADCGFRRDYINGELFWVLRYG